nr:hypothetical protein CFP56_02950 [Quercus suber]
MKAIALRHRSRKGRLACRRSHAKCEELVGYIFSGDTEDHSYLAPEPRHEAVAQVESPPLLLHRSLTVIPRYNGTLISFHDRVLRGAATVEDKSVRGNPFRFSITPVALESPVVLDALQAVSVKVIALHQLVYRRPAVSYHTEALSGMVGTIDNLARDSTCLFEACVACILLCWFEVNFTGAVLPSFHLLCQICCDTGGRWVSHLTGLLHLLGRRGGNYHHGPFHHQLSSVSFCRCEDRSQYPAHGKCEQELRIASDVQEDCQPDWQS